MTTVSQRHSPWSVVIRYSSSLRLTDVTVVPDFTEAATSFA
jgi:hypothetical protein